MFWSLNPCFNGRYSQRYKLYLIMMVLMCLNPCFNGRYSQRMPEIIINFINSLNPCFNGRYSQRTGRSLKKGLSFCLNPCFNGRYSQRRIRFQEVCAFRVLILVLMEDTLRDLLRLRIRMPEIVLILVLMEDTLRGITECVEVNYC